MSTAQREQNSCCPMYNGPGQLTDGLSVIRAHNQKDIRCAFQRTAENDHACSHRDLLKNVFPQPVRTDVGSVDGALAIRNDA